MRQAADATSGIRSGLRRYVTTPSRADCPGRSRRLPFVPDTPMPSSDSLAGLMKWLRREEWFAAFTEVMAEHTGAACKDAGITPDELADLLGEATGATIFGCAFEDFLTRDAGPDDRNIVDDYLKRRGWKEPVVNRRYMQALRHSTMSLYEVSDIVPGASFLARDLIRGGEPVRVSERTATRMFKPWDRLGARIVSLNGSMAMTGGVLAFSHAESETLLEVLKTSTKQMRQGLREFVKQLDDADASGLEDAIDDELALNLSAPLFTLSWLDDALTRVLHPVTPEVVNREGDPIAFCTVRYPLAPGTTAEAVRQRLRGNDALREASETFWNWLGPAGAPPQLAGGATVFGTVELTGEAVELAVNSEARAERGRALLTPLLGELVGAPLTAIETAEQAMAARPADWPQPAGEIPAELQAEIIHATLDDHYHAVLDRPVAMLGGITPRAAAGTAGGRTKLVTWLKYLENQGHGGRDSGDPMASYDLGWMWAELGVAALRR